MKEKCILVDLDGTLSNADKRKHYVEQEPKDWDAFYAGIPDDTPNMWCVDLLSRYEASKVSKLEPVKIILLTGRPEEYMKQTVAWLEKYNVAYDLLIMRVEGDKREDQIVKKELYNRYVKEDYEVLFILEDRKRVVEMWRKEGLICLQVAEGNF